MFTIAGLGNPGEEYINTRHNIGRDVVIAFAKAHKVDLEFNKKINGEVGKGNIKKNKFTLLNPDTFMNKSGKAVSGLVTSKKKAEKLIVIYDDMDLPLGKIKISFGKSSGGHRGLESVIKSIKTKDFIRIRVGVSKALKSGKVKKPANEDAVLKFILGTLKPDEKKFINKVIKQVVLAIETIMQDGRLIAMNRFN